MQLTFFSYKKESEKGALHWDYHFLCLEKRKNVFYNFSEKMAKVTISECQVMEPECAFGDPFRFRIRFNCIENLQEDLDWKIIYVGSANSNEHDQGMF